MKLLRSPYIPGGKVIAMLVSHDMPEEMVNTLKGIVPVLIRTMPMAGLPTPVSNHPDMQLVIPTEGVIVHAPNLHPQVAAQLRALGYELVPGETNPAGNYPGDVAYNVAVVGRHAFLNTRYADRVVLNWLEKTGKTISHVNQGYAKCSVCILNEEALITADEGIFRVARGLKMDALLIPPQKSISLPGYDYGFIGGSTGLVSRCEMVFGGDARMLDSAEEILSFLQKHGVQPVSLGSCAVLDLGSLIPLCTV